MTGSHPPKRQEKPSRSDGSDLVERVLTRICRSPIQGDRDLICLKFEAKMSIPRPRSSPWRIRIFLPKDIVRWGGKHKRFIASERHEDSFMQIRAHVENCTPKPPAFTDPVDAFLPIRSLFAATSNLLSLPQGACSAGKGVSIFAYEPHPKTSPLKDCVASLDKDQILELIMDTAEALKKLHRNAFPVLHWPLNNLQLVKPAGGRPPHLQLKAWSPYVVLSDLAFYGSRNHQKGEFEPQGDDLAPFHLPSVNGSPDVKAWLEKKPLWKTWDVFCLSALAVWLLSGGKRTSGFINWAESDVAKEKLPSGLRCALQTGLEAPSWNKLLSVKEWMDIAKEQQSSSPPTNRPAPSNPPPRNTSGNGIPFEYIQENPRDYRSAQVEEPPTKPRAELLAELWNEVRGSGPLSRLSQRLEERYKRIAPDEELHIKPFREAFLRVEFFTNNEDKVFFLLPREYHQIAPEVEEFFECVGEKILIRASISRAHRCAEVNTIETKLERKGRLEVTSQ